MEKLYERIRDIKGWAKRDSKDCPDITEDYINGWEHALFMLERDLKIREQKNHNKYFDILDTIAKEKIDITKLYILSCCNSVTDDIAWMQMEYTYKYWIEADTDLDLARLTDVVCDSWEGIHCGAIQKQEIMEMYLS